MELRLKYGKGTLRAEFKPPRQFAELHTKHIATLQTPATIFSQALDKPLGCHPFDQLLRGSRNVLLVVPNPSQHSGAEQYVPLLRNRLHRLRVPDDEIAILVAHSTEMPMPSSLQQSFFAEAIGATDRIWWHDPHDHKSLEYAGLTRRGTPVFINRLLLDADSVIVCGTVTHHPFAGYGGGPHLIVPGCAGEETIQRHLALAIDPEAPRLHPRCQDAMIEANPLQEDAREAFRFITTNFLLHTLLNDHHQMIGAVGGEPLQAFAAGCRTIDDIFQTPIDHLANLVIVSCGGFPNDVDYRTAHVALHHAARAIRPGGVIIFVAECQQGLGSPALLRWFQEEPNRASSDEQTLSNIQKIDWRTLYQRLLHLNDADGLIALSTMQKAREYRIIAVTGLEVAIIKSLGFTPAASLREALELALSWLPDIFSAFAIPNGKMLIPFQPG